MPLPRVVARSNKRFANHLTRPLARRLPYLAVVDHVGRRSGRHYATPVNVFQDREDIVVPLPYGSDSDWVRNVLAAGECELEHRGRRFHMTHVRLETDREKPWTPWIVRRILALLKVDEVVRMRKA